MRYMKWTWAEYLATPVHVVEAALEAAKREQQKSASEQQGPPTGGRIIRP